MFALLLFLCAVFFHKLNKGKIVLKKGKFRKNNTNIL